MNLDWPETPTLAARSVVLREAAAAGSASRWLAVPMCGTMSNLEVHHKEFRSHSGDDSEENLITLCTACHASAHHG